MDLSTQSWVDTGTAIDPRRSTKADVLWDGANQKLYVVSHIFTEDAQPYTSSSQWGRLYRYTYGSATKTYTLDSGFPVSVTRGQEEALTISKDSTGQLWITYVESAQVMVSHSLSDDLTWTAPFTLPVGTAANVTTDDMSGIVAFAGNKIGVFWSNQDTGKFYFSVHQDGDAGTVWSAPEVVFPPPSLGCTGTCSNDHFSLAASGTDSAGRVFAALLSGDAGITNMPGQVWLAVRSSSGTWQVFQESATSDNLVRPKVVLDLQHGKVYVFDTSPGPGGVIYYKSSAISSIQFPAGKGTPFIKSSTDTLINNATATKQTVDASSGLLVLASDKDSLFYLHNWIDLGGGPPVITSFSPSSGSAGASVDIEGTNFTGATAVAFNGTAATFTIQSDSELTATVPAAATTGTISVTNPEGTGTSSGSFTVTGSGGQSAPTISSFAPTSGSPGVTVTIDGSGFTGVTSVTFNGATAAFTIVSDSEINATVPSAATTGPISVHNAAGTATTPSAFTVASTRIRDITFEGGSLTDPSTGFQKVVGTVSLETASPLKGLYSATFPGSSNAYMEQTFTPTNNLYISFYMRINALPPADVRILLISDSGATIGNIYLRTNGSLRLRNVSAPVGSDTAPLTVGNLYRIGIHQQSGTGSNAVLQAYVATGDNAFGSPFASVPNGTWTTAADRVRLGATIAEPLSATFDDIRLDSGSMPGPSLSSQSDIKDITFEDASLIDPTTGFETIRGGTIDLESASPLKGQYSATIPDSVGAYLEQTFTPTDNLYLSFYLRINALPSSGVRILLLSDSGTSVGNIYLRPDGSLRLRDASEPVGSDTAPLSIGQLYRVGIHQEAGTGDDAVLQAFVASSDSTFGAPFASLSDGTWTTSADRVRLGATIAEPVAITADDIRISSNSMPGPAVPAL